MKLADIHRKSSLLVLTIILTLISYAVGGYAEVYKTVDKSGKVEFSDRPTPSADKIEIREPNTASPVDVRDKRDTATQSTESYTLVSITSPKNDTIIANGLVPFSVSTQVVPPLRRGHQLQLSINGAVHSTSQGSFNIASIARGQHSLQVAVIDKDNNVLKQSEPVKLFAYRPGGGS